MGKRVFIHFYYRLLLEDKSSPYIKITYYKKSNV